MTIRPSVLFALLACSATGKAPRQQGNFDVGKVVRWKTGFIVLALLMTWNATGVAQTGRGGEQPNASPKIDTEYWRVSNECAEAAARFWKLAGHHDGEENAEYSNHFNRRLGKCVIRLGTMSRDKDGNLAEMDEIYDAVEHVSLMSLWTMFDKVSSAPAKVTVVFTIKGKQPAVAKGTIEGVAEQVRRFKAQMDALVES